MTFSRNPVRNQTQTSAGGVAYRRLGSVTEVALISVGTPPRWQLPKGLLDPGESPEIAAIREVREEAGIDAEIMAPIDKVEYWYQGSEAGVRIRYHKFVHFFLMSYIGGDMANHDHEVHEARWFSVENASATVAFRAERDVIAKAAMLLAATAGNTPSEKSG